MMNMEQRSSRRTVMIVLLPLLLIAFSIYGLSYGSVSISFQEIWGVFTSNSQPMQEKIIMNLRLPRILIGLLVGACLATSGCLLQGVMKNPLADPGIIGVSAGGGLAAVISMILFPQYSYLLPVLAFGGSMVTSLLIYLLAWDKGASPLKIILAGVAINALLAAVTSGIMIIYSDRVQAVLPWLAGGLNGRSWYHLEFMAPYAIFGLLLSVFTIKASNLLMLGDDSAHLLGQKVELQRFLIIALSSFLSGTAVSVAGLIGFVGLVVPHAIRMIVGDDYRFLLPLSVIGGAALVVLADTMARSWFDPIELPVGILLAGIGTPFFLYLLKKRRIV